MRKLFILFAFVLLIFACSESTTPTSIDLEEYCIDCKPWIPFDSTLIDTTKD